MTTDPDCLTPDQRFADIARVLAAGVRRLFAAPLRAETGLRLAPENLGKSGEDCLEVGPDLRLSVTTEAIAVLQASLPKCEIFT
jgi:hypothetical protein